MSDLLLYTSDDGTTRLNLRVEGETIWLTQLEIAELFQTTKQNVSLHAQNIFKDGELTADSVVKESLTTAADVRREVSHNLSAAALMKQAFSLQTYSSSFPRALPWASMEMPLLGRTETYFSSFPRAWLWAGMKMPLMGRTVMEPNGLIHTSSGQRPELT